jgi:hypothetical protein
MCRTNLMDRCTNRSRAVVKTAHSDIEKFILNRELYNYQIPEIASCPSIRALVDTIPNTDGQNGDPPCLVFEWMDLDLFGLESERFRGDGQLFKTAARGMLSALALFARLKMVHTVTFLLFLTLSSFTLQSSIVLKRC